MSDGENRRAAAPEPDERKRFEGEGDESGRSAGKGRGDADGHWRGIGERREEIASVRAKMMENRGVVARAIDGVGDVLESPLFVSLFVVLHLAWVVLNLDVIPGLQPWDPYPFMLLATIASAEAPIVALFILLRQERDRRIEELRNEVDLQVSLHLEEEQTAVIRMLKTLGDRLDVQFEEIEKRPSLEEPLDPEQLVSAVEERLEAVEDQAPGE